MDSMFSVISVLFEFNPPQNINIVFTILMILLAIIDVVKKVDLKSQIVSLGILGTFFGIFVGLQGFDISNIDGSIPLILVGLKTAFSTSILGMFLAITLSVVQKMVNKHLDSDEDAFLFEILEELKLQNKKFDEFQKLSLDSNKLLDSIQNRFDNKLSSLENSLKNGFVNLDESLKVAINKLSENATKEIVNSLKDVISNFNEKLSSQFGENFKELNSSIVNLLKWQESYKEHLNEFDKRLDTTLNSLTKSSDALKMVEQSYQDVLRLEERHSKQIEILNGYLGEFATLSEQSRVMFTNVDSGFEKLNLRLNSFISNFEKFTDSSSNDLKSLTLSIQSDFETLKNSMRENLGSFSNEFKEFFELNSKEITQNFKAQQELTSSVVGNFQTFSNEAKNIPAHLRTSLGELNGALSALTIRFKEDYEVALQNHANLLNRLIDEKK